MAFLCRCGQNMSLGFRLIVFEHEYQVDRVPILECQECDSYEVLPFVKADLLDLINQLKQQGKRGRVFFTELNELADVMYGLCRHREKMDVISFDQLLVQNCEERINLLLDLYGCAQKMNDIDWMNEITVRLASLSKYVKERQFLGMK